MQGEEDVVVVRKVIRFVGVLCGELKRASSSDRRAASLVMVGQQRQERVSSGKGRVSRLNGGWRKAKTAC